MYLREPSRCIGEGRWLWRGFAATGAAALLAAVVMVRVADGAWAGGTSCNRGHDAARRVRRWLAGMIASGQFVRSAVALPRLPCGGLSRLPRGGRGG
jgi:hypothetical protein